MSNCATTSHALNKQGVSFNTVISGVTFVSAASKRVHGENSRVRSVCSGTRAP